MVAIDRMEAWLKLNSDCPDRNISEHRDTFASLYDIRDICAEVRRIQTEVDNLRTLAGLARQYEAERERDRERHRAEKAEADTKRLDWLDRISWNGDVTIAVSVIRSGFDLMFRDDGTHRRQFHGDYLRAAIDAAMPAELAQLRSK